MSAVPHRQSASPVEPGRALEDLSAFVDGEADQPAGLADEDARRAWDAYHWIGDIMRSEALARPVSARFQQNFQAALAQEPTVLAPRSGLVSRFLGRYAVPGASLAVLVIAVSWVAQPWISPVGSGTTVQASTPVPEIYAANTLRANPDLADFYDVHRHHVSGISGGTRVSYVPGAD